MAGELQTTQHADNFLSADTAGRAKMQTGFFDATAVDDKFGTGSIGEDRVTGNELHGRVLANGAAVAVGAVPVTAHAIPTVLPLTIPAGISADLDFTGLPFAIRVIDAWLVKTTAAGGGVGTVQLQTAGGVAISDAMSINVADEAITRAGSISDATHNIAAAGTLRVRRTRTASADESCILYVKCLRFV